MPISNEQAAELLCNALEGGSGYWLQLGDYIVPETVAKPFGEDYTPKYIAYPFSVGGGMECMDTESEIAYVLNMEAIERGKALLEQDHYHYTNVLQENADADTGDAFLQYCLIGEVIYG